MAFLLLPIYFCFRVDIYYYYKEKSVFKISGNRVWSMNLQVIQRTVIFLAALLLLSCGAATDLFSAYPDDPLSDLDWSSGTSGVVDIKSAFDAARQHENSEIGTFFPEITMPVQAIWDGFSDGEKALWLINAERQDRGLLPLTGLEKNVGEVAQYYADYLFDNDAWGHYEDGRSPWERLAANPAIGVCHDFLNVAENLAVFVSTGNNIPLPIERSVYMWMYDDGSCCGWGHRHAILWSPYNDNSGVVGMEGFLGIGRVSGGPYRGPFNSSWNYAEIIVMNVFDPGSSWNDAFAYVARDGVCSDHSTCYPTIDDAYRDSLIFREILIRAEFYREDLIFDEAINVTLSGGWDHGYNSNDAGQSVIGGSLTITAGTVIVDRIVIEAGTTYLAQIELPGFASIPWN